MTKRKTGPAKSSTGVKKSEKRSSKRTRTRASPTRSSPRPKQTPLRGGGSRRRRKKSQEVEERSTPVRNTWITTLTQPEIAQSGDKKGLDISSLATAFDPTDWGAADQIPCGFSDLTNQSDEEAAYIKVEPVSDSEKGDRDTDTDED